jgi:hypothetical protein
MTVEFSVSPKLDDAAIKVTTATKRKLRIMLSPIFNMVSRLKPEGITASIIRYPGTIKVRNNVQTYLT